MLVVDDNRDSADSVAELLRCWGYTARTAYDGLNGLSAAREAPPDCLLLDINMPGLDGYAIAGQVRADPQLRAATLIAFSARGGPEYERRATEAGFDHVLTKPADPGQLEELFRTLAATVRLAETAGELAGQAKELLEEMREELRELKQHVKDLRPKPRPDQDG